MLPAGTNAAQVARAVLTESGLSASNAPFLVQSAQAAVGAANQFVSFDVTNDVRSWVASPALNYGLVVTSPTASVLLDSKENTGTSEQAKLEIVLAGPQGATGATGATGQQGAMCAMGLTGARGPTGPSSLSGMLNRQVFSWDQASDTAGARTIACPSSHPILVSGGCGFVSGGRDRAVLRSAPTNNTSNDWRCMVASATSGALAAEMFLICSR